MTRRTPLIDAAIVAAVSEVASSAHYGYAQGLAAPDAIVAALAKQGAKPDAITRACVRQRLAALVTAGVLRAVNVIGPDGTSSDTWFAPPTTA